MSEDNIVNFPGEFHGNLSADEMLRNLADEEPKCAFVICWPKDGGWPTFHSNTKDIPVILLRMHQFIHKVLNGDFGEI